MRIRQSNAKTLAVLSAVGNLLLGGPAVAESPIAAATVPDTSAASTSDTGFRNGSFVVAPIPFSNETLGSGLALGGAYLFTLPGSKTSAVGLGGFRTDNDSEGYTFGGTYAFAEGKWTVGLIGGEAEIFYDLKTRGVTVPIRQRAKFVRGHVAYGLSSDVSVDLALTHLDTTVKLDVFGGGLLPPSIQSDAALKINRLDFGLARDTRDSTFYPTSGSLSKVTLSYGQVDESLVGGRVRLKNRDYAKAIAKTAVYRSVGANGVLAGSAVACGATDNAPFFDACGLGFVDHLRGFGATEYLARSSASMQAEYRGRITKRIGYVVFAGGGGTGSDLSEALTGGGGFAGGAGLRLRLSKKYPLDYAIDVAASDNGATSLSISVGQAF